MHNSKISQAWRILSALFTMGGEQARPFSGGASTGAQYRTASGRNRPAQRIAEKLRNQRRNRLAHRGS